MKFETKSFFITLLVSLLLTSCGTSYKTVTSSLNLSEVLSSINSHINEKDIDALINDYATYPEQRTFIESFLTSGMDYSSYQYFEIVDLMNETKDFDSLTQFYHGLEENFRKSVYAELAEMTLPSIADYYILKRDNYPFLEQFLTEVLLNDLADQPYEFMRDVSGLFKGTPLGESADAIIQPIRDSLLAEVTIELDEYFNNELSVLSAIKNQALDNASDFIEKSAIKVSSESLELVERTFLDKIMDLAKSNSFQKKDSKKEKDESDSNWNKLTQWAGKHGASLYKAMDKTITKKFGETTNDNFLSFISGYVETFIFKDSYTPSIQAIVQNHMSSSPLQEKISSSFSDFCNAVNEERGTIVSSWLTGVLADSSYYILPELIDDISFNIVDVNYDAFKDIEKIQARVNNYDADSFAAGIGIGSALPLIPYVGVFLAAVYEVGDFAYGLYASMKASELVDNNISNFTEKMVHNYSDSYITSIIKYFNNAENQLIQSQTLFKNYFNENF